MYSISRQCEGCDDYFQVEVVPGQKLACPGCKKTWGAVNSIEKIFDSCVSCQCNQFYTQKDFNQAAGCFVVLVGIALVPFSYGLSLPIFAGIDWLVYKRVPTMVVCYRCGNEFRGFKIPDHLKNFMHHIGVRYDKDE